MWRPSLFATLSRRSHGGLVNQRLVVANTSRSIPITSLSWNGSFQSACTRSTASLATTVAPRPHLGPTQRLSVVTSDDHDLPIISADAGKVAIGWDTRTWSRFHNIWLRDHCRCPKCFHPATKQRLLDTFEIPTDIAPLHIEAKVEGLEVTWPSQDPHVSLYPWSWLQRHSYDPSLSGKDASQE